MDLLTAGRDIVGDLDDLVGLDFGRLDFALARKVVQLRGDELTGAAFEIVEPVSKAGAAVEVAAYTGVERRRRFFKGDHWQGGTAWTGMRPAPNDENSREVYNRLRRLFVSKNIVAEVVRRHRGAVVGTSPGWTITPTERRGPLRRIFDASLQKVQRLLRSLAPAAPPAEQQPAPDSERKATDPNLVGRLAEIDAALVHWWNDKGAHRKIKQTVDKMLYARRGALRLFIPPAEIDENGQLRRPPKTLEAALGLIHISAPQVEQCRVHTEEESQRRVGVYVVDETKRKVAELTYLDALGRTVVRVVRPDDPKPEAADEGDRQEGDQARPGAGVVLDLGGRLTMHEIERDELFVSEQVIQNNQLVNLALTMGAHNVLDAGFSELFLFNVQMPTKEVPDPDAPGGVREEEETTLPRGFGVVNRLIGSPVKRPDGTGYDLANGSAQWKEPSSVQTFADTKRLGYVNILEEVQQLHALLSGDAAPSGESRVQALADFVVSLKDTKEQADALGLWLIETALALAACLLGDPQQFADLVLSFDTKIDTGKLTADERRALLNEVEKRLRSRQSAMILLGIDDPDAELRQIELEEQRLNPAGAVSVERQRVLLARDKRAAETDDEDIGRRLDRGAGGSPAAGGQGGGE